MPRVFPATTPANVPVFSLHIQIVDIDGSSHRFRLVSLAGLVLCFQGLDSTYPSVHLATFDLLDDIHEAFEYQDRRIPPDATAVYHMLVWTTYSKNTKVHTKRKNDLSRP